MVFASDLDRTLIYSSKFTQENVPSEVVEYKDGEPLSYMTSKAIDILESIRKRVDFIPVTTRTLEQYQRIHLFHGSRQPEYAITSNGGTILINGAIDLEWKTHIDQQMAKEGQDLETVYRLMTPLLNQPWVEKTRIADDVFFYILVYKEDVDFQLIKEWERVLEERNWELIEHGRKIYFIPRCVNKRDALAYIAKKLGAKKIVTSGDSRMDLTMEAISDRFIIPRHGELMALEEWSGNEQVVFTPSEGIQAAEEVIQLAEEILL